MKRLILALGLMLFLMCAPAYAWDNEPPPTTPAVGYDCAGKAVPPGATPSMCPGTIGPAGAPGIPGTTTVITHNTTEITHVIERCTSRRKYEFRVRKYFDGHRIVAVTASEPGLEVDVWKIKGRFHVMFSTAGRIYLPGGSLRLITVRATLDNKRKVRLRWFYRPCMPSDGNPNDPSASGQAASGQ